MPKPLPNPRRPDKDVDATFPDRWSPRSFDPEPLTPGQIAALFEAARWSPSCYNEQPWRFIYAAEAGARERFLETLVPFNQTWACHAPLLCYLVVRTTFRKNDKPNRHAAFDGGAAWMAMALQARRLGLHAHAMAGFRRDSARELLRLKDDGEEVLVAIAVGRRADPDALPDDLREQEAPNDRKPLIEVAGPLPEADR